MNDARCSRPSSPSRYLTLYTYFAAKKKGLAKEHKVKTRVLVHVSFVPSLLILPPHFIAEGIAASTSRVLRSKVWRYRATCEAAQVTITTRTAVPRRNSIGVLENWLPRFEVNVLVRPAAAAAMEHSPS